MPRGTSILLVTFYIRSYNRSRIPATIPLVTVNCHQVTSKLESQRNNGIISGPYMRFLHFLTSGLLRSLFLQTSRLLRRLLSGPKGVQTPNPEKFGVPSALFYLTQPKKIKKSKNLPKGGSMGFQNSVKQVFSYG